MVHIMYRKSVQFSYQIHRGESLVLVVRNLFGDGRVLRISDPHFPLCSITSVESGSATPRTVARQAPLATGFPRRDSWSVRHALLQGSSRAREQTKQSLQHLLNCRQILYRWATGEAHAQQQRNIISSKSHMHRNCIIHVEVKFDINWLFPEPFSQRKLSFTKTWALTCNIVTWTPGDSLRGALQDVSNLTSSLLLGKHSIYSRMDRAPQNQWFWRRV